MIMRLKGHRPFCYNQFTRYDILPDWYLRKKNSLQQSISGPIAPHHYYNVFKTILHNLFLSGSPLADYLAVNFIVRGVEILI